MPLNLLFNCPAKNRKMSLKVLKCPGIRISNLCGNPCCNNACNVSLCNTSPTL